MDQARILVVEDQGIVAEDIRENLEQLGYEVPAIASSGEEAIQKVGEIAPDLIMMDIRLQGKMDGVDAAGCIHERFDVPVVYLTAYADDETLRRAKQTQPFGYLIKPFKEKELHTTIEIALYKHGVETQLRETQAELQSKVEELERQEVLRRVWQQMREVVWKMRGPEDIKRLLEVVKGCLKRLEVPFRGCGINVIDERSDGAAVHTYELNEDGYWEHKDEEEVPEILMSVWSGQKVSYRRDLASEDPHQEKARVSEKFGPVRSVLDVPFSHGTLAVNSPEPDAFSEEDIEGLQVLAESLSEGFHRLDDLKNLATKEEQLRQSQKMEAVGQLAGGVAHDFNNLITVITGYCQLLLKTLEPDTMPRQNVQEIMRAGDRAAVMVRQLLTFSRRQVVEPQVIDLGEVIADIDKMLRRVIGEDVELIIAPGTELDRVETDPGQMEQVIMNLAVNARDAMPDGGRLIIETANVELDPAYADQHAGVRPGPHVMLAVSDTGTGMDAETRARIFEPFFTTKERGKGTGLGLSTVYGIVKQSNGHIGVYSEPGAGTTFKIYLPRTDAESRPEERSLPEVEEELDGSEAILVVEDDETVRQLVQRALEERGYSVRVAQDGDEGLRIGAREGEKIDLLLTDVIMPGLRGYQLAEQLLAGRPDLKVLYMSGYTDRAFSAQELKGTNADFLAKPIVPDDMLRKIRGLLDRESRTA